MGILFNLGNVLYLAAFSVRSILWLRILTVVASLCLMPYYCCQPQGPLYQPICWSTLFIAINLVQITWLILERRPVFLGEEELHLYRTVFSGLKPREYIKLLSIAEWKQAKLGDELLAQDHPTPALMLISTGRGTVEMDGRHVAELRDGQFIGEMGFLTEQPASARVVAAAPTTYLFWPVTALRELLTAMPALHLKMQGVLGSDLVGKLRRHSVANAHPSKMATRLRDVGAE
jgi:CRP-like cAMP-binding protein